MATGGAAGMVVAGALGAAGESTALQYLNTGHVDPTQVAESAVIGGITGGAGSRGGRSASVCKNSFAGSTPVLMADGCRSRSTRYARVIGYWQPTPSPG